MKNALLLHTFFGAYWAIQETKLHAMVNLLNTRMANDAVSYEAAAAREVQVSGSAMVIPVVGVISQRMNMLSSFSGGVSTEMLGKEIRDAVNNPNISTIILDIDSPGGSVYGVQELASYIREASEKKTIIASVNSLAASAAYWIAASASEISMMPSGEVGSIGVIAMHVDWSGFNEQKGIDPTYIYAGRYKSEGNEDEPLSDEARTYIQGQINTYYDEFIAAVAAGRSVSPETAREKYGQGRTLLAREALNLGMIDRIETFDETVRRATEQSDNPRNSTMRRRAAELQLAEITL